MAFFGGTLLMAAGLLGVAGSLILLAPPVSLGASFAIFVIGYWFAQAGL
jgi:hypothetical protein